MVAYAHASSFLRLAYVNLKGIISIVKAIDIITYYSDQGQSAKFPFSIFTPISPYCFLSCKPAFHWIGICVDLFDWLPWQEDNVIG